LSCCRYELSQDLLDKQMELLERKYGGSGRANHAARVIQRAFRHYSMRRKFATITAMAKAERRLSRRLLHAGAGAGAEAGGGGGGVDGPAESAEYVIRTNFAALYRELAEQTASNGADPAAAAADATTRCVILSAL